MMLACDSELQRFDALIKSLGLISDGLQRMSLPTLKCIHGTYARNGAGLMTYCQCSLD